MTSCKHIDKLYEYMKARRLQLNQEDSNDAWTSIVCHECKKSYNVEVNSWPTLAPNVNTAAAHRARR